MFTPSGFGGGAVLIRLSGGCSVGGTPVRLGWEEGCSIVTGALLVASGTIIQSAAIALWQVQMLRIDCSYTYFLQDATGWDDLDWSWKWVSTENNNFGYASYPTHVGLNKRIIQS